MAFVLKRFTPRGIELVDEDLDAAIADLVSSTGPNIIGRAVTAKLLVSPNGNGNNGFTWTTAYPTIQAALDAASTNDSDCTLIIISPHGAGYYDINRLGDPTWAANVIIMGTHRNWAKVKNDHVGATSVLKLTGRSSVINLNINLGTGNNGLIQTRGGARTRYCQFVGENLTSPATALWYDTDSAKHFKALDCDFLGHITHMTAFKVDQLCCSELEQLRIHKCLVGIHVLGADADENLFDTIDIGDCAKAIKIDAGSQQHFNNVNFHHNTVNIEDAVGDNIWNRIYGQFPIVVVPDDLAGVQLDCGGVGAWGADTEVRAAASATKPFRIVGVSMDPSAAEWYTVRFSADSGVSWYDTHLCEVAKREGAAAPSGTEFIFNVGTRISASARSISGGNNIKVWIEIQEI